jgi:hypothetical protein
MMMHRVITCLYPLAFYGESHWLHHHRTKLEPNFVLDCEKNGEDQMMGSHWVTNSNYSSVQMLPKM